MSRHVDILRKAKLEAELYTGSLSAGLRKERQEQDSAASWRVGAGWQNNWQQLAHQIFLRRGPTGYRVLGLASPTAGEGTSYVASHVAAELARLTSEPVLLLEANVYRPSQAERHGVEPDPGLRQVLSNSEPELERCLRESAADHLWLLPAGAAEDGAGPPDWTHLRKIFQDLRARFSAIIADLPPVNLSSDTAIIGPLLDAVLLVVEADLCSREVIQNAVTRLRRANPNIIGSVLNKRKFFVPDAIYRRL